MEAEVFYLYHLGEQRGPYTARQVNHLHRCEFIDDDTLYWREGMEQWAPITQIVLRRRKRRRLIGWTVTIAIAIGVGILASFFGPVTMNAWRELTSGGFSEEDAYWRSRLMVRQALGDSASVKFDPIEQAKVLLQPPAAASVVLTGQVRDSNGTHRGAWRVRMIHVADQQQWLPAPAATPPPPPPPPPPPSPPQEPPKADHQPQPAAAPDPTNPASSTPPSAPNPETPPAP